MYILFYPNFLELIWSGYNFFWRSAIALIFKDFNSLVGKTASLGEKFKICSSTFNSEV